MLPKKSKILILSWEAEPIYLGGLGVMVKNFSEEAARQGVESTILIPHKITETAPPNIVSLHTGVRKYSKLKKPIPNFDFHLEQFNSPNALKRKILWPAVFQKTGNRKTFHKVQNLYPNNTPILVKAYAWAVLEYLQKSQVQFDCILGADWMAIPAIQLLKEMDVKTPMMYYVNSIEYERDYGHSITHSTSSKAIYNLEQTYFPKADKILAVSQNTKDNLIKYCDVPKNKVVVVLNDVDFIPSKDTIEILKSPKNVLYIGRLAPQKGLTFLLDTAQKVVEIDSQIKFIIAGDGDLLSNVVEEVAKRSLERNCLFTGWLNNELKKKIYKASSLFVMPSSSEPFGLTALESIASDVPVIASTNCGFTSVVKSTPVFNYHDTDHFAQLILQYLDPASSQDLLKKQKDDLKGHSWPKEVAKFVNLIA